MNPYRVIIIEDDPMVTEVNRSYVEAAGNFQVVATSRTGQEGVELVATLSPDLVILDVYLPDQTGVETLKQIRRLDLDTDVIMVTAAQDAQTIQDALRHGAVDYIIKPFKFERIQQTLQTYAHMRAHLYGSGALSQEQLDRLNMGLGASPGIAAGSTPGTTPGGSPGTTPDATQGREAPARDAGAPLPSTKSSLPKGLTDWTLRQVLLYLVTQNQPLSAGEVADGIGLARVTVRRYLDYLVQEGRLRVEQHYGPVGRPLYRYTLR